jgi:hypothetical protein
MTGLIAVTFGVIFFILGGVVIGGVMAWIAYGIGYKNCEAKYGKKSDFKKKEVVTYEKKDDK